MTASYRPGLIPYTDTATLTVVVPVAGIRISPDTATIAAGDNQHYTASTIDSGGHPIADVTGSTTFSIGGGGSCNNIPSDHSCSSTVLGDHTVTGTYTTPGHSYSDDATLTVAVGSVDHIVISPGTATITAGGSQNYTAEAFDAYGHSRGDVTGSTTFTISGLASSCSGNTCTSTRAGNHTVTGRYNVTHTDTATLTVTEGSLDHIRISPSYRSITAGDSQSYTATAYDAYDNSMGDVTGLTTLDIGGGGSCSGNSCTSTVAGDHTVTGTYDGRSDTATLRVTAAGFDHFAISPSTATIAAGGTTHYTASTYDIYDNPRTDVTLLTTFSIGGGGTCTNQIANHSCTSTVAGDHTVTGTFSFLGTTYTDTAVLTVLAGPVAFITISPDTASIDAGDQQLYGATGEDQYHNSLGDVTASTTFSISGAGTCNNTDHSCGSNVPGSYTVTGTNNGAQDTADLTVNLGPLDHILISPDTATIPAGGKHDYTAEAFDKVNNLIGDVTADTTFSIDDGTCTNTVAEHSCGSNKAGARTVTGTYQGKSDEATLTVNPGALDHIVISPKVRAILVGTTQDYAAEAFDALENSLGPVAPAYAITGTGSCSGNSCGSADPGDYTVTGTFEGLSDTASLDVVTLETPAMGLVKSATEVSFSGAGQTIHYNFRITNNGNVTLKGPFTVTDPMIGGGVTCPVTATLAPGRHIVCTGTYTTTDADVLALEIVNKATAHGFYETPDNTAPDAMQVIASTEMSFRLAYEEVQAETGGPSQGTAPSTGTSNDSNPNGTTPLFALLICAAFASLALVTVQVQRRSFRR